MDKASQRAQMPKGSSSVLNQRSLEKDYSTLSDLLRPGLKVLDVGCGAGAISKGIADKIGPEGSIIGMDMSAHLIEEGKKLFADTQNLHLTQGDIFSFQPKEPFDLIVSARVLQWLKKPQLALQQFTSWLKPGGIISILDYNHTALEWNPAPPKSMLTFYQAFLDWRSDAGMNNQISEDLPTYFASLDLQEVEIIEANEVYQKGQANFLSKVGIWTKVAETRGNQLVKDGYITEEFRLKVINEYDKWSQTEALSMTMKLKDIRGKIV